MASCESSESQPDIPITGVGINRFIRMGHVKSVIAKHSAAEANKVIEAFQLKLSPFKAADAIRDYCGEEVAFLFHFLAFLQYWLVLPAVFGGLLSLYMLYLFFEDNGNGVGNNQYISRSGLSSAYGIAFMLYMSLIAEQWKRHSNDLCFKWGTANSNFQSKFSECALLASHCVSPVRQAKLARSSAAASAFSIVSQGHMFMSCRCRIEQ
jgi:hypothetical protein